MTFMEGFRAKPRTRCGSPGVGVRAAAPWGITARWAAPAMPGTVVAPITGMGGNGEATQGQ